MIRRINIFAGPGAGKSTLAADIFVHLKQNHIQIELVTEYIKDWVYLNMAPKSFDQIYIFAKQLHKEDVLLRSDDKQCIVTDSPLMMQLAYMDDLPYRKEVIGLCNMFEQKYPSLNIFLDRNDTPYQRNGRYSDYQQAKELDLKIENNLKDHSQAYAKFSNKQTQDIFSFIKNEINE